MQLPIPILLMVGLIQIVSAADYYVDPAGNDSSSGTSEAAAWQSLAKVNATTFLPGDRIRFKKGGTWQGTLWPKGSGDNANQITLTSYGTGAKPLIDGAGGGTAITLSSQSYWTIDGLEVTNFANGAGGNRCGIRVGGGGDGSTIRRIRILNNDVHDIQATPDVEDGARNWGGIFIWIDEPGKADEVLIQGNTVTEIQGQGISFWGEWENPGGGMNYANCSPNVVVRDNRVWRTSGDGILTLGTDNELVEYNEVGYAGVLSGNGNNIAAAWPTRHRNGVWQYNHVHHTKWLEANDSTAFDNDGFVEGTTYFQYNYTHDNEGGFHMEYRWVADTGKTVSRYNISVNDGRGTYARIYFSNRPGSELYNNVFYNPGMTLDVSNGAAGYHVFSNNIFVGAGRTASFDTQGVYYNNTFSGGVTRPTSANNNRTRDPLFVSPNTTGNLAGFLLQATSLERNTGLGIASNGGKDFWSAAVPASPTAPHRGASQLANVSDYTATPTFIQTSGPFTAGIPPSGSASVTYVALVRDQNFRAISTATPTWSLVPVLAGYTIHPTTGVVTISNSAVPARFAVVATSGALSSEISVTSASMPATWNNSVSTGKWNTSDANWTGDLWENGASAVFSHTSAAETVTLEGPLSANDIAIGNGSNNARYTLTGAPGSSLAADSLTVQGAGSNDPGVGAATLSNVALDLTDSLGVGRWDLVIGGTSALTLGGQLRATSDGSGLGDWGRVTIQDNANIIATGGVNGAGTAWGLTLNGGTLTTPSIRAGENSYSAGSRLTFNGTTVVATQDTPSFVTVDGTNQAYLGTGGAILDTNGKTITIGVTLTGSGGLTKSGSGTLTLSQPPAFSGDVTVIGGLLSLGGSAITNNLRISGGTLEIPDTGFRDTPVQAGKTIAFETPGGGLLKLGANANFYSSSGLEISSQGGAQNRIEGGFSGGINANGQVVTFTVARGSDPLSDLKLNNSIWNGGSVVKDGNGILEFAANNSYTGTTTTNAGTLVLKGTYASGAYVIVVGAVLELNAAGGQTDLVATTFSGAGTLRKTGTGGVIWGAAATNFSLGAGSLIDVQEGSFTGGSYANENWSSNISGLHVASGASFNSVEANVRVDAISGAGTITSGYSGAGYEKLTIGVNGGSGTFSGTITDGNAPANIVKEGAGTQTLSGNNNYTGTTAINGGTLLINGSSSASSAVTVANTATLGGTGTIGGTITVDGGGSLAPGTSIGTLAAGSAAINGTLAIEISSSSADRLNVTGNLNITNATLAISGSLTAPEYVIASYGSLTGTVFPTITGLPSDYTVDYSSNQIRIVANPTFASWIEVHYPTLTDKTPTGDPDNDGVENALEYVLGGNPSQSDSTIAPTSATSGNNLVFIFQRADASETADISLSVEAGTDLSTWQETYSVSPGTPTAGVAIQENEAAPDTITVTIPQGSGATKFARLRVVVAP